MGRLARHVVRRFQQLHGSEEPSPTAPPEPEEAAYSPSIAPSHAEDPTMPEDTSVAPSPGENPILPECDEPYEQYAGFMDYVDEEVNRGRLPAGMAGVIGELVRRFERFLRSAEDQARGARDRELEELQSRCNALSEALNQGTADWDDVRRRYRDVDQANRDVVRDILRELGIGPTEPGAEEEGEPREEES